MKKDGISYLKGFLISRFFLVMILIALSEYILSFVLERTLFPAVLTTFFPGSGFDDIRTDAYIMMSVSILGGVIPELVSGILPSGIQFQAAAVTSWFQRSLTSSFNRIGAGSVIDEPDRITRLALFLILFLVIVLAVIPFAAGAAYYSAVVIKEVQKLEEREREKNLENERKRNRMLSDIAHDLRTPLTTVNGYAKALTDGMVPESDRLEYLKSIQKKSVRMSELMDMLFDYVRLDSEGFTLKKESLDLCELLRECVAFQYEETEQAGILLDIDIPESEWRVEIDRLQFSRCISNLITNAIRHGGAGIRIGVICRPEDGKVFFADSGEPISSDIADRMFEPFAMGDDSRNSRNGSGLGLSIVKKIVDMHGFSIRLSQGSALSLPAENGYTKAFVIEKIPSAVNS